MCDMTHSYAWHDSFICVTWLIHMCDMTHSYVWHDSFIMWHITHSHVSHDSFICCIRLMDNSSSTWHMTRSYVRHDSPAIMWHTTHSYVSHDSFICDTWLTRNPSITGHKPHSYVRHRSRRRSDFKYLDLQNRQFSCPLFWVTGTPVYSRENYLKFRGFPWTLVWKLRGLPWKLVWFFGCRRHSKSDLLRPLWLILDSAKMWNMTHSYVRQCLIHMCHMIHSYVWQPPMCVVSRTCMWHITHSKMCDMTHSYLSHDLCVTWLIRNALVCDIWLIRKCVTWLIHVSHDLFITHLYVTYDSFVIFSMTRSYVARDSVICVTYVSLWASLVTHYVWPDSFAI